MVGLSGTPPFPPFSVQCSVIITMIFCLDGVSRLWSLFLPVKRSGRLICQTCRILFETQLAKLNVRFLLQRLDVGVGVGARSDGISLIIRKLAEISQPYWCRPFHDIDVSRGDDSCTVCPNSSTPRLIVTSRSGSFFVCFDPCMMNKAVFKIFEDFLSLRDSMWMFQFNWNFLRVKLSTCFIWWCLSWISLYLIRHKPL